MYYPPQRHPLTLIRSCLILFEQIFILYLNPIIIQLNFHTTDLHHNHQPHPSNIQLLISIIRLPRFQHLCIDLHYYPLRLAWSQRLWHLDFTKHPLYLSPQLQWHKLLTQPRQHMQHNLGSKRYPQGMRGHLPSFSNKWSTCVLLIVSFLLIANFCICYNNKPQFYRYKMW